MSGSKVKGILKYITQMFETDKEQDIQIGFPTDVKHVAHIGWDGPSVNSPSWMTEFKGTPGDVQNKGQDNAKCASEDSKRRNTRDMPDLPKASKRQSNGNITDSPTREKASKPRHPRKSSNKSKDEPTQPGPTTDRPTDPLLQTLPVTVPVSDIPKKSRRKSKENSSGGASKLRSKAQPDSETGSPTQTKSRNKPRSFEENAQDVLS